MSHLKKLSQVLNKLQKPKILPISVLGRGSDMQLCQPSFRHISISRHLKDYQIASLLLTASSNGLVSLSPSQLDFDVSGFCMLKAMEENKWAGYTASQSDYRVFLNPKILDISSENSSGLEECASIPHIITQVERPNKLLIQYMNLEGEYVEEEFKDFEARVAMHEIDHTWGYLITDFAVSYGRIHCKSPELTPNIHKTLGLIKDKVDEAVQHFEDKIAKSAAAASRTDRTKNQLFYERQPIDEEFEDQFKEAFIAACMQDFYKEDKN